MKKDTVRLWFAKRRKTLLSGLGSLILLGTFIAKDVIRDDLKDYVSDLNAVRDRYRAGANARDIEMMLTGIGDGVARIDGKLDNQSIDARYKRVAMQNSVVITDMSLMDEDQISGAIELAHTLPDDGKLEGELKKGLTAMKDFDTKQAALEAEMAKTSEIKDLEQQLLERARLLDKEKEQMTLQSGLSATGHLFTDHTIELAEQERKRKERQYQVSRYASWGFYFVGWLLTLLGLTGGREIAES